MMDDTEDVVLNFGEEEELDRRRKLKHPIAVTFHVVFRVAALLAYLFCQLFSSSFITNFVVILTLVSMDFWTVKNVSGRLLVGLRWWNYVDDDGKSHWLFESRKGSARDKVTVVESRIFWLSLVISQLLWFGFLIGAFFMFSFKWIIVVCLGLIMNGANLYGYVKCKLGSKKPLTAVATAFLGQQVLKGMMREREETKT